MMTIPKSAYPNLGVNMDYANCRHFDDFLTQCSGSMIAEVPTKIYYKQTISFHILLEINLTFKISFTIN